MTTRYTLFEIENLSKRFEVADGVPKGTKRQYNISPTTNAPVVLIQDGKRVIEQRVWGLIPQNAKDTSSVFRYKTFAARSEVIFKKPSLAKAIRTQRCLVPANGFYEWRFSGGEKVPYFVQLSGRPLFAMAGIYSSWTDPEGKECGTYSVVTIDSHSSSSHTRIPRPVILSSDEEAAWLDLAVSDMTALYGMMRPYTDDALTFIRVSDQIDSTKPDSPDLIAPLA